MTTINPFLTFQGDAVAAVNFYADTFPDGAVDVLTSDAKGDPQLIRLSIAGQEIMVLESPIPHAFGFSPAMAFSVTCDTAEEVNRCFTALVEGGEILMELAEYPFNPRFGCVTDRYGITWQIGQKTPDGPA